MPYDKWFWDDWFASTAILSITTKGVWHELLGRMYQADRTYYVDGTVEELARLVGCSDEQFETSILEIERRNVADVTRCYGNVAGLLRIECRRCKRSCNERERASESMRKSRTKLKGCGEVTDTRARKPEPEPYKEKFIKENFSGDGESPQIKADDIERIFNLHPRRQFLPQSANAIKAAILREMDCGKPYEEAVSMIERATDAYADAVSRWPRKDRQYVVSSHKWFEQLCYLDDPATWERGEEAKPETYVDSRGDTWRRGPDGNYSPDGLIV